MIGNETILIDTNVLVYYYDTSNPDKHKKARSLIDSCWKNQANFAISSQNLSEFFSVATTKDLLTKKQAADIIYDIIEFSGWVKINFTHHTIIEATFISEAYDMPYWDSLIAATMKQNSVLKIYTENTKDFKVPWLVVENPFEK